MASHLRLQHLQLDAAAPGFWIGLQPPGSHGKSFCSEPHLRRKDQSCLPERLPQVSWGCWEPGSPPDHVIQGQWAK
jgi:hypothetical protein